MKKQPAINDLLKVMAKLRSPTGCPWDREQSHLTLRRHAIEEVYELIDAIEAGDEDGSVRQVHHCAGAEGSDDLAGAKLGRGHGFCVQSFKFLTPRSTLGSTSRIERLARNFRRTGGRFGKSGWRNG